MNRDEDSCINGAPIKVGTYEYLLHGPLRRHLGAKKGAESEKSCFPSGEFSREDGVKI